MGWFFCWSWVKCFNFCENSFYFYWFLQSFQQLYRHSHRWCVCYVIADDTVRAFLLFLSVHGLYQIRTRTPPFPLCLFWLRIRKADVSVVSTLDICGNTVLCSCQSHINTTLSRNGSIMIWMFLVSKFKFIHIN